MCPLVIIQVLCRRYVNHQRRLSALIILSANCVFDLQIGMPPGLRHYSSAQPYTQYDICIVLWVQDKYVSF